MQWGHKEAKEGFLGWGGWVECWGCTWVAMPTCTGLLPQAVGLFICTVSQNWAVPSPFPWRLQKHPLKICTGHSWSMLIASYRFCSMNACSSYAYADSLHPIHCCTDFSLCQDGFCTNLESKNLNVIAYTNKKLVAYKIFILIRKLIAYLIMLKQVLWISEMRAASLRMTKMKSLLPLWGLLKFKGSLSE